MAKTSEKSRRLKLDAGTWALTRRLLCDYVRRHAWRIVVALLCMAAVAACTAGFTQLIKPIVNDIFVARDQAMLWPLALAAFLVFAIKGLATYGQAVLMSKVGFRIVADIQIALFERLMGADLAYFHRTAPGKLVARFINDANLLRGAVSNTLTGFGKDLLTALALVGVMFYEDAGMALVSFFVFPAAIGPIVWIGRRMRRVSRGTQSRMAVLTTLLDEVFQGIRHVKAYGMEARETARARAAVDAVYELNLKAARTRNASHPIMETLGGLAIVAVILYGGNQVIAGARDPGSFFAFITAVLLAYEPVKRLSRLNASLQEGLAAAQRVFEILDMEPRVRERPDARPLEVAGGCVRLEGVDFSYDESGEAETAALHRIDLEAAAGRTLALVGPSGAGKSTILNLIPRFYDPGRGRVTIDGQDVSEVTFESLRERIALVSQEVLLFDDSLRANIAYGRPEARQEEIEAAARHAGAHDFITALPEGYETRVGPRGVRLSGGERQRIAIARAMLKDAPILLLDEATSALDSDSERQVQQALSSLMAGRTTVVIAHRLSTVRDADLICVLEGGRVVERGSHAELLARGGAYARLHALQFEGQSGADETSPAELAAAGR